MLSVCSSDIIVVPSDNGSVFIVAFRDISFSGFLSGSSVVFSNSHQELELYSVPSH